MLSQSEIYRLSQLNKSGFSYKLPDGTIIPDQNGGNVVDTVGLVLGRGASPIPAEILKVAKSQYTEKQQAGELPTPGTLTEQQLQNFEASRGGFVEFRGSGGPGTPSPANPNTPNPFGVTTAGAQPGSVLASDAALAAEASRTMTPSTGSSGGSAMSGGGGTSTGGTTTEDQSIQDYLNSSSLSPDLKAMVQTAYNAIAANDQATADRLMGAFNSASQYSDPYFKAQISLVTDALSRGLKSQEGDLSFKETNIRNTLSDLNNNISASKDYLSFKQNQELKQLSQNYEQELENTRQNLASVGKTHSSVRASADKILGENYDNLVASSNRAFSEDIGGMDRQLTSASRDATLNTDYYRRLAEENKLNLLRGTEEKVGSNTLSGLGYQTLGGIGGEIPRQQVKDALSFSSNFVF